MGSLVKITLDGPLPRIGEHVVVALLPGDRPSVLVVTAVHHGYRRALGVSDHASTVVEVRPL